MYALFERIDDKPTPGTGRLLVTRFQISGDVNASQTSTYRSLSVLTPMNELKDETENVWSNDNDNNDDDEIQVNRENILFVYLDLNVPLNRDLISPLRIINNDVQIFSNSANCLEFLEHSNDAIFFISSSNDKELIKEAHNYPAVEAIFIFNPDRPMDRIKFPKLVGIYAYSDELLLALKNALEWFGQTHLEFFIFQRDQTFLWLQMWKEFIKPIMPKVSSNKEKFIDEAENYYRGNTKLLKSVDDFDYCYERSDVLQWCFSFPFPSRFLHHALSSCDAKYIDLCHFLINDISRVLKQSNDFKANRQVYRGLKVTNEGLKKLMEHTGKLICPKGFFTCMKSRKAALDFARSSDYRIDLRPLLFKINYPPSVPIGEIPMTGTSGLIVFDVYTAFRVKSVDRGPVSVVKLEPADEDGRDLARAYRAQYQSENVQSLLDELSTLSKPLSRLPPIQRPPPPPSSVTPTVTSKKVSLPILSKEEKQAQKLVRHGKVDQALGLYQRVRNHSPHLLNTMGHLYGNRKGDYNSAVKYYKQAMKIQEKNGEDITGTLTQLGIAHHNRRDYGLALACHNRALALHKNNKKTNQSSVANSLIGIANAQWGQDNLSDALQNAQQALAINESAESGNDLNLAMNLAVLANIHHKAGDNTKALGFAQRALAIIERCVPSDSLILASILNNLGAIQIKLELLSDAQHNFDRAYKICEKTLPEEHPRRATIEKNIELIKELIRRNENNSKVKS